MTLRIKIIDGEAQLVIDKALTKLKNMGPVMAAIAGEVDDRVQESFSSKRSPQTLAGWPELKVATVIQRARQGYDPTDTLRRTRILQASVVTDSDDTSVETSTGGVEYAIYHQFGAPKAGIPPRPFAGISDEDASEFEDMIADFIAGP